MKLSKEEKAARRAAFQNMSPGGKLDHIFTYYKWTILLILAALLVLGSVLHRQITKKETVLSLAFVNVAVGEALEADLTDVFLRFIGADEKKQEVYLYRDLYLSDNADELNHEYAYASRVKLMSAVSAGKLDLVLMNREAYDLLSRSGYLLELKTSSFSDTNGLYGQLSPYLTTNEVILSDNDIEYQLGEAEAHETKKTAAQNGVEVSSLPLFRQAGFYEPIYLGVIANTNSISTCIRYLAFLLTTS